MRRAAIAAATLSLLGATVPASLLGQVAPPAQNTSGPPVVTLASLERMAIENNPTLAQATSEIDAARGRARQAGMLPNPTVGYTGS